MNPLLSREFRVPFDRIGPDHIVPGVRQAVEEAGDGVNRIVQSQAPRTYQNTVAALDSVVERLERAMGLVYHLMAVSNENRLRQAFDEALPIFSEFYSRLPTNQALWGAVHEYSESDEASRLTGVRARRLDKLVAEFRRAGADLPDDERQRVEEIRTSLARLATDFGNNLLDATNAFELLLEEESDLAGLPESAVRQAQAAARQKGLPGWRFTLQAPSYVAFMQYSERRDLRRLMYQAYSSRAFGGEHDNRGLVRQILALRRDLARILGYGNFADYRLELNMVKNGAAAVAFEQELYEKTVPYWRDEVAQLEEYARRELLIDRLEPWDIAFTVEKLRRSRFELDREELRPYFPLEGVVKGLFEIARRLYGLTITETENEAVWHPDVRYYVVHDEANRHVGSFYADWFPRESKRGGAWMNGLINGEITAEGELSPHLGLIVTNFTMPHEGEDALLTHDEVETAFHEFGHLLHHLLSKVEVAPLAGTHVPRDWVELPSHIMENWTWQRPALDLFARHVESGSAIPTELFDRLLASRTFMQAAAQMRQLSFGTLDLALHIDFDPESDEDPLDFGNRLRERFVMRPDFAHDGFICAFAHIFAGGYAAGYYSYKWSEMLEADAFTRFEENGIFDRATGQAFAEAILSKGDSKDPAQQFRDFMGRDPDPEALLKRNLGSVYPLPAVDADRKGSTAA